MIAHLMSSKVSSSLVQRMVVSDPDDDRREKDHLKFLHRSHVDDNADISIFRSPSLLQNGGNLKMCRMSACIYSTTLNFSYISK